LESESLWLRRTPELKNITTHNVKLPNRTPGIIGIMVVTRMRKDLVGATLYLLLKIREAEEFLKKQGKS
jgi:hypothetical protein